jgi:Flp pilus assembly protein TadG
MRPALSTFTRHVRTCRAWRAARFDEQGQAVVEFALLLPVLLLILFAILQFALSLNAANDQTNIASEVARYAVVNEDPGGTGKSLQEWGKEQAYTNYTTALNNEGKVCITFPSGKATVGEPVRVEVTSMTHWIPLLGKLGSTEVKGTAYMRLEAAPTSYSEGCA